MKNLLKTYLKFYKQNPWVTTIASLLYIISPIDILPDFIPILGQIDDLLLLGIIGLFAFKAWRQRSNKSGNVIDVESMFK